MGAVTAKVTGGDKAVRVLEAFGDKVGKGGLVRVGYLESAKYPDGTSVAQVAVWQEYGTPNAKFPIPPRPTFRMMIAKHKSEWSRQLAILLKTEGYDSKRALSTMGGVIRDELVDSVLNADVKQLSPVTLMVRSMKQKNPSLKVTLRTIYAAIGRVRAGLAGVSSGSSAGRRLVSSGDMSRAPDFEVVK